MTFAILWITSGLVGAYLAFLDWTRTMDMDWAVFLCLLILVPTGPACLLFGILVSLGGPELPVPKFFKSRNTEESSGE